MTERFLRFYWDVYVPDHSAPLNRWVHFLSNLAALGLCGLGAWWQSAWVFALGVWCQLGPPYLGHILFEKTHRSIDQNWLFAAVGSWFTTMQILLGRQTVTHGPTPQLPADRRRLGELLRDHGRDLHSFMVLESGLEVWTSDNGDAAIAYADRGGTWVAVGSPLCPPDQAAQAARDFAATARRHRAQPAFFGVSEPLLGHLCRAGRFDVLAIGEAPTWDPANWDHSIQTSPKLRNRLRRGRRQGIRPRIVNAAEVAAGTPLRAALDALADQWARAKPLPPLGFMATVEPFEQTDARRYFVAEHADRLVGCAVCVPIYGRGGWLVEDLLMAPDAPAGATEVLIDGVMRGLAAEGAALVSLGLVALAGVDQAPSVDRHPLWRTVFRAILRLGRPWYNFHGVHRFRKKLQPDTWEPVYLVADGKLTLATMWGVLSAFTPGGVPAFALRAAWRWVRRERVAA